MIEAVHSGGGNTAVGIHTVPALPNGGSTQIYRVQPAGIILIEQQPVSLMLHAVVSQHSAQERRAHKAGLQLSVGLPQFLPKPLGAFAGIGG